MFDNVFQEYLTAKNIIFFIILVVFIVFLAQIKDIAIMFFASFVIACSLEPIVATLSPKLGRKKSASVAIFVMLFAICAFFVPLIVIGGQQVVNFADSFPQYMENLKGFFDNSQLTGRYNLAQVDIGRVVSSASNVTSNVLNETVNFSKNIGSAFVYLVASLIIVYYFMADKETIERTYLKMFPTPMRKRAEEILKSISQKVGGYVIAQITTMASVGIIMTIGLLVLRVDYALLLGLITAVLDIIPVIGPALALVICLIAAYKSGIVVLALLVLVFAIAQLAENNFVRPYVFGKFLDLHPLIIYLFLFITAKFMGVVGVIFAPAIAATAVVLIQELYMKNLE